MKTVRFTQVVERCGQPSVHTLWTAPEHDSDLKRAQKSNRLMMVFSPKPGKAEQGVIGFDPNALNGAQLLIFPRSLKPFAAARVIGIKFDLIAQPKTVFATPPRPSARPARPPSRPTRVIRVKETDTPPRPQRADTRGEKDLPTRLAAVSHTASPRAHETPENEQAPIPERVSEKRRSAEAPSPPDSDASDSALVREVAVALDELKSGKIVAARQRLKTALRDL